MNIKLICDFNENFDSKTDIGHINDHQTKELFEKINNAIKELGYNCEIFGGTNELIRACDNEMVDQNSIYINLSDGTDTPYSRVQIPIMCDILNLKYSGGGTFETALATNKYYSSLAVRDHNLLAPNSIIVTSVSDLEYTPSFEKYMIKPNSEGSSIGINNKSVCDNKTSAIKQAKELMDDFSEIIIEEYIAGYDVTCFVIGNEKIILNEPLIIKHHNKMFFENEVMGYAEHANKTRIFLPCDDYLEQELINDIKNTSVKIKNIFNIKDFCRIDYRITESGEVYFLEINTVPAISMDSQVGVICKHLSIEFNEFVKMILNTILKRFNHE